MDTDKFNLDEVDRGILHLLQEDARNNTTTELAEEVGVSPSTIGNRIKQMENDGILKGYFPEIDYGKTGLELHLLITGEVSVSNRAPLTEEALDITGVVSVQELLTGVDNLLIEAVALEVDTVTRITSEVEDMGVNVKNTQILGTRHIKPFDHFGAENLEE